MSIVELSRELSSVVATLAKSVVMVDAGHRRGASGLVWSAEGVIVTAAHKLVREEDLRVGVGEGEPLAATLVGVDPSTDVAVLRVDRADLTPVAWAPSASLAVGQLAVAVARPGRTARAALGVIGTLGADRWATPAGGALDRYIETDIGGRPGFSGGVLGDVEGRAVGMSTGGVLRGVSLAVPHETVARVVTTLLTGGRVSRGWLGVGAYPVQLSAKVAARVGRDAGLVLVAVAPDGPGDHAGLMVGDVLLSLDAAPLDSVRALQAALIEGQDMALTLLRAGEPATLTVRAGARP